MTPYVNTYYYKTELIFARLIEKIRAKKEKSGKTTKEDDERQVSYGIFGLALGIGLVGSFWSLKEKIFK